MTTVPEKGSLLAHLSTDRRYLAMLGLGFSAGMPYLLVYPTQAAWLSDAQGPCRPSWRRVNLPCSRRFALFRAVCLRALQALSSRLPVSRCSSLRPR